MNTVIRVILILFILIITAAYGPCQADEISSLHPDRMRAGDGGHFSHDIYAREESGDTGMDGSDGEYYDYQEDEGEPDRIADPLEPVNRVFFQFNDKLYFWVLKPVARAYSVVVPEGVRISVRNVFDNLRTPVRLANNLIQLKFRSAGDEALRFCVNSTVGMLGLYDVARDEMGISMKDEDFGQTLGVIGMGPVFYVNWPLIGPSSVRDSIGYAADYFLDPVNYVNPYIDSAAISAGDVVNRTSLSLGDYENIKKDALDPYTAFRDIYYQYRKSKISR